MRKKLIKTIVFIVLLQPIFINFTYVEALGWSNSQPPVCNWPSEMMSYYFKFQKEMKSVLLWSDVQERRFNASVWNLWLFGKWSLKLPSAVDLVASSVLSNAKATVSMAGTSVVLLMLAAKSVLQSNTEWFAILFKDRPIVRDYKTMLDIETDLFDLAYFRSKQMNLTVSLDKKETYDNLNKVIEKYQWYWLLYKWKWKLKWDESLAAILEELVAMNTVMKHFILFWWAPWDRALKNYYWCFWSTKSEICKTSPVLKFDSKAIEQLKEDYSWLWTFGACNLSFSNFKNSIKKSINNNSASVKSSFKDVKMAMNNLKLVLLGNIDNWKWGTKSRDSRCDLSDYEIAQLRAYWWPDWTCDERVKVSVQMSMTKEFMKNKWAQNQQRKKNGGLLKSSAATNMTVSNVESYESLKWDSINLKKLKEKGSMKDKDDFWKELYWLDQSYNSSFLYDLGDKFVSSYEQITLEYNQSQRNAASSDLSPQLKKIKWILEQVKTTIRSSGRVPGKAREKGLEYRLKKVAAKQCVS